MSNKLRYLDHDVGRYNLARDLAELAVVKDAAVTAIIRGRKGYAILWQDGQGYTVTVRVRGATSIGKAHDNVADATQELFSELYRIGLIDPRIKVLTRAIDEAIGDCEMALDGRWDKDDEGFEATLNVLVGALREAGVR